MRVSRSPSFVATGCLLSIVLASFCLSCSAAAGEPASIPEYNPAYLQNADYKEYHAFCHQVYETMAANYYRPVSQENLKKFLYVFNTILYPRFKAEHVSSNLAKWRSSGHLIDALKAPEDVFSGFYAPQAADQFEQVMLGKNTDLGIKVESVLEGYRVTHIEPRVDAYEKGLRENDILLAIDNVMLTGLSQEEVVAKLTPQEGQVLNLRYLDGNDGTEKNIEIGRKEYFQQFVSMIPVDVPGVSCLRIERFNRKTGEDMGRLLEQIMNNDNTGLIIDLRDNPGGPPLAAREISGFFLPPNEEFAYFQRRGQQKTVLSVPETPVEKRYTGKMVILVNKGSGSASELFAGILQKRKRAVVMGTKTAGQVMLKSMFRFQDGSLMFLVTGRGYHPDGTAFSFDGVTPDVTVNTDKIDLVKLAAEYMAARQ